MNRFVNLIVITAFLLASSGFYFFEKKNPSITQLHWLKGKWSRVASGVEHYESWNIVKDSLMEGEGYYLKTNNKKVTEKLAIKWINKKIVYVADVPDNNGPVNFEMSILNDTMAVFENSAHDYPNKITYIKTSKRDFKVILSDNSGKKKRTMTFKLVTKR
ncbi:hypothetical protein MASR1M107_11580 [Ignavibacteriales bacterium]